MAKNNVAGNDIKAKRLTNSARRAITGRLFILPWVIGLIYFFISPLIKGAYYTFHRLTFTKEGLETSFIGLKNYKKAFADTAFIQELTNSLVKMLPEVLVIVFFSLFVALILRENFKGRTVARAVFFLPVIISSGVVITILKENVMLGNVKGAKETGFMFKAPNFEDNLASIGLPESLLTFLTNMVNQMFDLTWKSGVQILLLLAAVNNIPKSSYEAADIEEATGWEKFWKITFPLVTPTLLVAVIYSIIDSFTDYGNKVMRMVSDQMQQGHNEYSSTIAFIYFVFVLAIIAVVGFVMSRKTYYADD